MLSPLLFRLKAPLKFSFILAHKYSQVSIPLLDHYRVHSFLTRQNICHNISRKFRKGNSMFLNDKDSQVRFGKADEVPFYSINDTSEFYKCYDVVYNDFLQEDDEALADVVNWCSQVFYSNLKNGKKIRGLTVLKAYQILSQNNGSPDGPRLASILGWCIEMLQAFLIISDDIMDQSSMRRGEPCWYKKPEVGLSAINDGILLQSGIYKLLQKHFGRSKSYIDILHEFLQVTQKTACGQCLDMLSHPPNSIPRFENFTRHRYDALVMYKTSYYTFCLPVHLAMHLVGSYSFDDFLKTRLICFKLGLLFQSQDDYLDCFGDSKVTGKLGNDILEGKCTWLAVTFLDNAPDSMRKEMMDNYGVNNEKSVSKVLKLYEELSLKQKYMAYENQLYSEIVTLISEELPNDYFKELFYHLLHEVFRRQK